MNEGSKGAAIAANEATGVGKLAALLRTEKGKVALVCGGSGVAAGALLPCLPFHLRITSLAATTCVSPRLPSDLLSTLRVRSRAGILTGLVER